MIRPATQADLPQVVAVHRTAFEGFLMTELGPRFLRGYYQQVLEYPQHLFLVWQPAETALIEGICGRFLAPHEFYQQLRARKWSLALGAAILSDLASASVGACVSERAARPNAGSAARRGETRRRVGIPGGAAPIAR
jgi:hypothetical protein